MDTEAAAGTTSETGFANPPLECDLVMKGGITSGVIYPLAVCELAHVYRFRSIGGSSAGAIAAAAAAAAELGRDTGGFDRLAQLPHDLTESVPGQGTRLLTLFQPAPKAKGLFRVLIAGLGRSGLGQVKAVVAAALRSYAVPALVSVVVAVVLAVIGFVLGGPAAWLALVLAVLIGVVGMTAGVVYGLVRDVGRLPDNGFGVCSGMSAAGASQPAMTSWLHTTFQTIAGRTESDPPITFGELAAAGIDLQVMTTNLSRREPLGMPWTQTGFRFDPTEFRGLFPEAVVAHLEAAAQRAQDPPTTVDAWVAGLDRVQAMPLLPFPETADLPILVAVRMSLSFPGLIAAVPLHCADYSLDVNKEHREAARAWHRSHPDESPEQAAAAVPPQLLQRNWFSDGGICANLPLHFFDAPLPTRPTFAVDLATFPADRPKAPDEYDNSYLPDNNAAGLLRRQSVWKPSGLGAMASFAGSILTTARGWVDEAQLSMPGYRDRVVTIYHDGREGGMNLDMDQPTVTALSLRGQGGAKRLSDRFAGSHPGVRPTQGWDNQRWIRFRVAGACLDTWLKAFGDKYVAERPGTTPYEHWVGPDPATPGWVAPDPPSYPMTIKRRAAMRTRVWGLRAEVDTWRLDPADALTNNTPAPSPALKIAPSEKAPTG